MWKTTASVVEHIGQPIKIAVIDVLPRLAVLACLLATPVVAQEVDAEAIAKTARLGGDALIAEACHLRPEHWFIVAMPAISAELTKMMTHLSPSGGVDPEDVAGFPYTSLNQATVEGQVESARYGQAACKAIDADGSLARIDALVAGFKKPG